MGAAKITINTTPTIIVAGKTNRRKIYLKNEGDYTVYIGSDNTSTSVGSGFPIEAGEDFDGSSFLGSYWGICDTGETGSIAYLEEVL